MGIGQHPSFPCPYCQIHIAECPKIRQKQIEFGKQPVEPDPGEESTQAGTDREYKDWEMSDSDSDAEDSAMGQRRRSRGVRGSDGSSDSVIPTMRKSKLVS